MKAQNMTIRRERHVTPLRLLNAYDAAAYTRNHVKSNQTAKLDRMGILAKNQSPPSRQAKTGAVRAAVLVVVSLPRRHS
jgi:hypothetical protein